MFRACVCECECEHAHVCAGTGPPPGPLLPYLSRDREKRTPQADSQQGMGFGTPESSGVDTGDSAWFGFYPKRNLCHLELPIGGLGCSKGPGVSHLNR